MAKDPVCGMNVDAKNSLSLQKNGTRYYFCGQHCLNSFARQQSVDTAEISHCSGTHNLKWYRNKIFLVAAGLGVLTAASYGIPFLTPFRKALFMYFSVIWWAILLGLFLGGVIDYFIPREYISKILARREKSTVFHAVILGFFMSLCSHGILALAIQLHKKGASTSAVVAFLLASPWANLPLTFMLIGFFGLTQALYIILCAIIVAVITGLVYQWLESRNLVEINQNGLHPDADVSILKDIQRRVRHYRLTKAQILHDLKGICQGAVALSNMVLWWILIGVGLASFAGAYIPEHIFQQYMGPSFSGMLVTLLAATVIEVCSEGSSPLAFEIFRQTGALGNSFVFLMAGVATDYTEIGLLWHNVGRKTALWLPVITVPQVMFWGILANVIF